MSYLFAAYAVFWALTFLFVFSIASRQSRLEKEIEALRRALARENRPPVEETDAS
jgi:CcmD family protein